MLDAIIKAILPNPTITESQFMNAPESELLKTMLTSQVTYFGICGVGVTAMYKFAPKYYLKLHRYAECRQLLEYATPWHLFRSLVETGIEYAMSYVGYKTIPWVQKTFPSPTHALVMWNSVWPTMLFGGSYIMSHSICVEKAIVRKCTTEAPWQVMMGSMFSGNDIGSAIKPFYEHALGKHPRPFKRTIFEFLIMSTGRLAISSAAGKTAVMTDGFWKRIGIHTAWFMVDIFALRSVLIPMILDKVAPYEVDGVKLEVQEIDPNNARPFEDEDEENAARTELMGLTSEQMSHVSRFCWDIIIADHVRGSVKALASKWLRYTALLAAGTSNEGVTDLEDVGRVASIYENDENELDTHGVDDEHRTCSVCLVEYEKKDKIATIRKCKHTFHLACVEQWWAQHNNCPICRGELLREQSGEGDEKDDNNNNAIADPNNQREAAGGGADAAAAAEQQEERAPADPVRELYGRLFRMSMAEKAAEPEWEWGPLKHLFYTIGMEKGLPAVHELMQYDPELTMQQSPLDLWHVAVVNLCFVLPNWNQ